MSDLAETVESLNAKIDRLITLHQKAINDSLEGGKQNQELTQKIDEKQQEIDQMKQKNHALAIAKTFAGDKRDSQQLKLKINELIRDLDKCIAMLNQ